MKNKAFNYLTLIISLIAFTVLIISYFKSGKPITALTYTGLALMVPAFILLLIARIQLGASFTVSAQATKLVSTGLYKRFRHPIYYSGILLFIGLAIFLHQPIMLVACIALIILQIKRVRNEEKILEEKFGEAYRTYKKNTWF